jgi:hypothetical protein
VKEAQNMTQAAKDMSKHAKSIVESTNVDQMADRVTELANTIDTSAVCNVISCITVHD